MPRCAAGRVLMRLICPNCDAEYEVDDAAIPSAGRDVQCSNCGHAWFQDHPGVTQAAEEEAALFGSLPTAAPEPETAWEPEDVLAAEAAADVTPPAAVAAEAPDPAPATLDLPRRSIDESVLAVLREEAEREAAARRGDRPRIETQTELALPEAPRPPAAVPPVAPPAAQAFQPALEDPVAPPDPDPVSDPAPAPAAGSKRALLPAIEEIKSSLNPTADPDDEDAAPAAPPREGFRSGFVFALLIAVVLLAVYVLAPLIGAKVPALKAPLEAYVTTVNAARLALDTRLRALIGWLQGLADGSAG